ncbi:DUF1737 domain-containing protein [Aeromonas dhakensis]|nr:DUF1737 domain-containing protein [Aeromonas dhakensis]MBL0636190.1 DUF1737 domain-containing protein [Aeromonas dhakensis]MDX7695600.1 DUF1737 domain-containing protein [Aeromonas dhakensis]BEE09788.1 hypothetical protein VAWG003_25970 [Aeromonas dhakensis]BEE26671.1 hypothetical protein VAWG005_25990 [Aeromonas dhakensis]HDX8591543.1 DUF1737 domain-containing protein [Aeromonas dhakensis]
MVKLYRFISGPDDKDFCMRITELMNRGWELHHGPTLTFNGNTCIVGQALTKEVADEAYSAPIDLTKY